MSLRSARSAHGLVLLAVVLVGLSLDDAWPGVDAMETVDLESKAIDLGEVSAEAERFPGPFQPGPPPGSLGTGGYELEMGSYNLLSDTISSTPDILDCGGINDDNDGHFHSYGPGRTINAMAVAINGGGDDNDGEVPDLTVCREKCNTCAGCVGFMDMMEEGNCYFFSVLARTTATITGPHQLFQKYFNKVKTYRACPIGTSTGGAIETVIDPAQSNCVICQAGQHQSKETMDAFCQQCPAGKISNENTMEFFSYDSETEPDRMNYENCQTCPAGWYSDGGSDIRTLCRECQLPQYAFAESAWCKDCPRGTFGNIAGLTADYPPAGTSQDDIDNEVNTAGTCMSCKPGKFAGSAGSNQCGECAEGQHAAGNGNHICEHCAAGKYTDTEPRNQCKECAAGFSTNGQTGWNECKDCANGKHAVTTGMGACENCPPAKSTEEAPTPLTSCVECTVGKFNPSYGIHECTSCPEGHKAVNYEVECHTCDPGKFADSQGLSICMDCGVGDYFGQDGAISCTTCGQGTYEDEMGSIECKSCPAGHFDKTPTQGADDEYYYGYGDGQRTHCATCPVGKRQSSVGSTECEFCTDGKYQDEETQLQCKNCAAGEYSAPGFRDGVTICTHCDAGKVTKVVGDGSCKVCPEGFIANDAGGAAAGGTDCDSCTAGYYSVAQTTVCQTCPTGHFSNNEESSCTSCPEGWFGGTAGLGACQECGAGTFMGNTGADACKDCQNGHWAVSQPGLGTVECSACQPGTISNDDAAVDPAGTSKLTPSCMECPDGWNAENAAALGCTECPGGHFTSGAAATGFGACVACGLGEKAAGPAATACTACAAGYYSQGAAESCNQCDAGTSSDSNGRDDGTALLDRCTSCLVNHYAAQNSATCTPCAGSQVAPEGSESCKTCPDGMSSGGEEELGETAWYDDLCVSCPAGKHSGGTGVCLDCPQGWFSDADGGGSCDQCPQGKFQDLFGSTICKECAQGKYNADMGSGSMETCLECDLGQYSTGDADQCVNCPGGHFSSTGASVCTTCSSGKYMLDPVGEVTCTDCNGGFYQTADGQSSCLPVTAGNQNAKDEGYLSLNTAPVQCEAGTYSQEEWPSCLMCPTGYFQDEAAAAACKGCAAGKYMDEEKWGGVPSKGTQTQCKNCPTGQTNTVATGTVVNSAVVVNIACTSCAPGYRYRTDTDSCVECGKGKYSSSGEAPDCVSCPGGYYANQKTQSVCKTCASGKYSTNQYKTCSFCSNNKKQPASDGESCETCPAGYYQGGNNAPCNECSAAGKYGANGQCKSCPAGYYNAGSGPQTDCQTCDDLSQREYSDSSQASACQTCPSGQTHALKSENGVGIACDTVAKIGDTVVIESDQNGEMIIVVNGDSSPHIHFESQYEDSWSQGSWRTTGNKKETYHSSAVAMSFPGFLKCGANCKYWQGPQQIKGDDTPLKAIVVTEGKVFILTPRLDKLKSVYGDSAGPNSITTTPSSLHGAATMEGAMGSLNMEMRKNKNGKWNNARNGYGTSAENPGFHINAVPMVSMAGWTSKIWGKKGSSGTTVSGLTYQGCAAACGDGTWSGCTTFWRPSDAADNSVADCTWTTGSAGAATTDSGFNAWTRDTALYKVKSSGNCEDAGYTWIDSVDDCLAAGIFFDVGASSNARSTELLGSGANDLTSGAPWATNSPTSTVVRGCSVKNAGLESSYDTLGATASGTNEGLWYEASTTVQNCGTDGWDCICKQCVGCTAQPTPAPPPSCTDTPGWTDDEDNDCTAYCALSGGNHCTDYGTEEDYNFSGQPSANNACCCCNADGCCQDNMDAPDR